MSLFGFLIFLFASVHLMCRVVCPAAWCLAASWTVEGSVYIVVQCFELISSLNKWHSTVVTSRLYCTWLVSNPASKGCALCYNKNRTKCEMIVVKGFFLEKIKTSDIHCEIWVFYRQTILSEDVVRQLVSYLSHICMFRDGWI